MRDNKVLPFGRLYDGDSGGRPPYDGDMEARLSAVEARLTGVEGKLDHIDKEVSNFKWWVLGSLVTIVITVIATVIGTSVSIQQMTVTTFQAAQSAQEKPAPSQQPIIINVPPPAQAASK